MWQKLSLARGDQRAWVLYDWANSAMVTVIITAVYPFYFAQVLFAGAAEKVAGGAPGAEQLAELSQQAAGKHALATTLSMLAVAITAPVLGAIADVRGCRKRFLGISVSVGVLATAGLFFVQPGQWVAACLIFGLANFAAAASFVFYDSLLPSVAEPREYDRLSTTAYAIGYLGGGTVLGLALTLILKPEWFGLADAEANLPVRLSFLLTAVWWLVFSIPVLRKVREQPPVPAHGEGLDGADQELSSMASVRQAFGQIRSTWKDLGRYRNAMWMMLAFFAYNDGIGTIIRMASLFAAERNLSQEVTLSAILMVQFVGVPFAFLFGALAKRIGAKRSIFLAIGIYAVICLLAGGMQTARGFYAVAFLVGAVQGGAQALSRSLFASMIPQHRAGEFFGLFAVLEKFAGILGPAVFGLAVHFGGSSQKSIGVLLIFFAVGAYLLTKVNVEEGQRVAREDSRIANKTAS